MKNELAIENEAMLKAHIAVLEAKLHRLTEELREKDIVLGKAGSMSILIYTL